MDKIISRAATSTAPAQADMPAAASWPASSLSAPRKPAGNDQLRGLDQRPHLQDHSLDLVASAGHSLSTPLFSCPAPTDITQGANGRQNQQAPKAASTEELVSMMGRGAMMPVFVGAMVYTPRAIGRYRMLRAEHIENPRAPVFRSSQEMKWPVLKNMYNPDTRIGKALETLYLPSGMKAETLTKAQTEALNQSGAKVLAFSRSMGSITTAGRLAINGGGIATLNQNSRWQDMSVLGMDSLALTGKLVENAAGAAGMKRLSGGAAESSAKMLRMGRTGGFVGDGLFIATGTMRIADQLTRDDTKWSAVGYGIQDVTLGTVGVTQNAIAMQQAAHAGTIDKKISVLSGSVRMSTPLQMALRLANTVGAGINLTINGGRLADAMTDRSLTPEQREERVISGSLGVASATCLAAGSMLTLPVSLPVGMILIVGGGALGAAQTIYDYRREIRAALGN